MFPGLYRREKRTPKNAAIKKMRIVKRNHFFLACIGIYNGIREIKILCSIHGCIMSRSFHFMRILVIEDQEEISNFLKLSLQAECFSVDVAGDGERGSMLARTNEYDAIILDNLLPEKTGLEVCREIRKRGKNTPILMLSVRSDVNTKVELLNAGADDYLIKPFSFEELLARLRAILRRPDRIEGDVLQADDVTLDAKRQAVFVGEKEVYLTRKEFMLFEYLLRNKGTVLSRSMIMEHVWDMSADPFSNTIESHILSLRRKIDALREKGRLIQTVPSRGYKIDF